MLLALAQLDVTHNKGCHLLLAPRPVLVIVHHLCACASTPDIANGQLFWNIEPQGLRTLFVCAISLDTANLPTEPDRLSTEGPDVKGLGVLLVLGHEIGSGQSTGIKEGELLWRRDVFCSEAVIAQVCGTLQQVCLLAGHLQVVLALRDPLCPCLHGPLMLLLVLFCQIQLLPAQLQLALGQGDVLPTLLLTAC